MGKGKKTNRAAIVRVIVLSIFAIVTIGLAAWAIPYIQTLNDPAVREQYKSMIDSMGVGGFFVVLGIQVLQVVIAIIPGEPVEILAGVLFGGVGGLLLCMLGILIGTVIIFYLVKLFGKPLVDLIVPPEKFEKLKFLHNTRRLKVIVFVLFMIPGTPKDLLTYIVPLTDLKPKTFFAIATLARIPSIITSTFAGAALYSQHFGFSLCMFGLAIVLAILGIIANKIFTNWMEKRQRGKEEAGAKGQYNPKINK